MTTHPTDLLEGLVREGLATGWQLFATGPDTSIAEAGGADALGRPIAVDSCFSVYCAIKPLTTLLVGSLIDDGELSLDDRVGDCLPGTNSSVGSNTIEALLSHASGITQPDSILTIISTDPLAIARSSVPTTLGEDTAYTEAAAWLVARAIVDEIAGPDLAMTLLSQLGLADHFDLGDEPDDRHRLNVSFRAGPARPRPLLLERTAPAGWRRNPGFGGRASVIGLAGLANEFASALDGQGKVLSAETATALLVHGTPRWDRTLEGARSFTPGWLADLRGHRFGEALSPEAFGYVGMTGMTAVWADPAQQLVCAYHVNGLIDGETMIDWFRPAITSAVVHALEADVD